MIILKRKKSFFGWVRLVPGWRPFRRRRQIDLIQKRESPGLWRSRADPIGGRHLRPFLGPLTPGPGALRRRRRGVKAAGELPDKTAAERSAGGAKKRRRPARRGGVRVGGQKANPRTAATADLPAAAAGAGNPGGPAATVSSYPQSSGRKRGRGERKRNPFIGARKGARPAAAAKRNIGVWREKP